MKKTCDREAHVLTCAAWRNNPSLVHGFGDRMWEKGCFDTDPELSAYDRIILRQVHSDIIHEIKSPLSNRREGDALMTAGEGLLLIIKTADCLPILLTDATNTMAAAAHCGWRGTARSLITKLVHRIKNDLSVPASSLTAVMGPCIGSDCYEVGPEVHQAFLNTGLSLHSFHPGPSAADKFLLDLKAANRHQMEKAGIPPSRIFSLGPCTHCEPAMISFRRDRAECDRMFSFIGLQK
ncbi:MAG: peptidoglycan editing factor PgeF [Acidobacteria bacterium]|nr:peptidoglycan editing factor PgeF [Acidobacteriota bacterium]